MTDQAATDAKLSVVRDRSVTDVGLVEQSCAKTSAEGKQIILLSTKRHASEHREAAPLPAMFERLNKVPVRKESVYENPLPQVAEADLIGRDR